MLTGLSMNEEENRLRERAEAMVRSAVDAWSKGEQTAALSTNAAALEICRRLVRASPTPSADDVTLLLACLRNASTMGRTLGRGGDAIAWAEEGVAVSREHSKGLNLASTLNSLAVTYRELERLGDAIPVAEEALSEIWREFEANPSELAEVVETLLRNFALWHREAERELPAIHLERVNKFQALVPQRAPASPAPAGDIDVVERLLNEVAKAALIEKALNHDDKIVDWACQLMDLLHSLAWRIRGLHMSFRSKTETEKIHWIVTLPSGSPDLFPLQAIRTARNVMAELSQGSRPSAAAVEALANALRAAPSDDHLVRVARGVEKAGGAGSLTLDTVRDVVDPLLAALRATAVELEASPPKMAEPGYVGDFEAMPLEAVLTPTPGEATRVITHVIEVTERHFETKIRAFLRA
jgi:hypothetical protein